MSQSNIPDRYGRRKCPNCQLIIDDPRDYCPRCGALLATGVQPTEEQKEVGDFLSQKQERKLRSDGMSLGCVFFPLVYVVVGLAAGGLAVRHPHWGTIGSYVIVVVPLVFGAFIYSVVHKKTPQMAKGFAIGLLISTACLFVLLAASSVCGRA